MFIALKHRFRVTRFVQFLHTWRAPLGIHPRLQYLQSIGSRTWEGRMADDKCESQQQPQSVSQPAAEGTHMVKCVKFGREMPGLDRPPWKGELGQRIYDNVSKEGWKMWIEHSKMIMNEYRLNPLDPQSQKIIAEQMENFFFGEGAQLPPGFVAQKSKS